MALHADQIAALSSRSVIMAAVVEIDWDVPVYLWEGDHPITIGGKTYTGVSTLGRISQIRETTEVESTGVELILSGVDPSVIYQLNTLSPAFPVIRIGIQLFDQTTRQSIQSPIVIYSGFVDSIATKESENECVVVVSTVNALDSLDIVRPARYTREDQSILFPEDTCFNYVAESVEKYEDWGSPYRAQPTTPPGWDSTQIAGNGTVDTATNREFNHIETGVSGVRATVKWGDGRRYAEVVIGDAADHVGVATYLTDLGNELSSGTGNGYEAGVFAAGDVIGIAFDRDRGYLWHSVNGVWSGHPEWPLADGTSASPQYTGVTQAVWVACTKVGNASNHVTKINLKQSEWQYAAPTGYPYRQYNTGDDELSDIDTGPQPDDEGIEVTPDWSPSN